MGEKRGKAGEERSGGGEELGFLPGDGLGEFHGARGKVQFQRAAHFAQRESDEFTDAMGLAAGGFHVDLGSDADILEGVEPMHGEAQFLLQEFLHVGEGGGGTGQIDGTRGGAALALVLLDPAVDLTVQSGELVANDLGHGVHFGIVMIGIIAAEMHEAIGLLASLGMVEIGFHFLGDGGRDIGAADREGGHEQLVPFHENSVGHPAADINEEGGFLGLAVAVAEGIVKGNGAGFDEFRVEACAGDALVDVLKLVRTDGRDGDLGFTAGFSNNLIVPDGLRERKRHGLLGFKFDNIADLILPEGGHLHETGDGAVGRNCVIDIGSRGLELVDQTLDRGGSEALAGHVRADFAGEFLKGEVPQQERPLGSQGEAGHADALGTKIEGEDCLFVCHRGGG